MEEKKITIEYIPKTRANYTDKMYRINLGLAVFVTLYILGLMTYSSFVNYIDLTPSAYIIAPIWVEVGAFSIANIKKHEKENKYADTGAKTGVFEKDCTAGADRYEEI